MCLNALSQNYFEIYFPWATNAPQETLSIAEDVKFLVETGGSCRFRLHLNEEF